jgi:2-oxoglutarate ferredoxin oxidoreductase subunit beta
MAHPGFSIVHVQSPCTTYNDTYEVLKGNVSKGIEPMAWEIPEEHDPSSISQARGLLDRGGIPLGILYKDTSRQTLDARLLAVQGAKNASSADDLLAVFDI